LELNASNVNAVWVNYFTEVVENNFAATEDSQYNNNWLHYILEVMDQNLVNTDNIITTPPCYLESVELQSKTLVPSSRNRVNAVVITSPKPISSLINLTNLSSNEQDSMHCDQ